MVQPSAQSDIINETDATRVRILSEALPYISSFVGAPSWSSMAVLP
jgi:hypothetical protein